MYNIFYNATFFHSGYINKPLQPSSAIYGALPFTGHWKIPVMQWTKVKIQ